MDTSDEHIVFDSKGVCNYCLNFDSEILPSWNHGLGKENELAELSKKIKKEGLGREFDCIIGHKDVDQHSDGIKTSSPGLSLFPLYGFIRH